MSTTIAGADAQVAALIVEVRFLSDALKEMREELKGTKQEVAAMKDLVAKYRGGLAVILGAGALVGWVLSNVTQGMKLWH